MKTTVTILVLLISFCAATQDIKPLKVGDRVPDKVWQTIPKKKGTKLVIIDFWATWCMACLNGFPKMEKLQSEFDRELQIVLINAEEDGIMIKERFSKMNKTKTKAKWLGVPRSIPAVNGAYSYKNYFPHYNIPHHVWLDATGNVLAITDGRDATSKNVEKVLKGKEVAFLRRDYFRPDELLYVDEDEKIDVYEYLSFFRRGKIERVEKLNKGRANGRGRAMRNLEILEMYKKVVPTLNIDLSSDKRILIEVNEPDRLMWRKEWDSTKTPEEKEVWEKENLYTYDLILPSTEVATDRQAVSKQILQDLNRYSPYFGAIEKLKVKCLVLIRTSTEDKIKVKESERGVLLRTLTTFFQNRESVQLPVIDKTGYTGETVLGVSQFSMDLNEMRKELQKYDLDLIEAETEIEMFVIRDKKPITKTTVSNE